MNAKYISIIALAILSLSLGYYSFALQSETIEKRIERENRQILIKCLESAGTKSTSQEVLQATRTCNENILTKITNPIGNTGSGLVRISRKSPLEDLIEDNSGTGKLAPTTSEVPLGKLVLSAENVEKKQSTKMKINSIQSVNTAFWETYSVAIPLIQKYEGLHLKAYPDYKGCSIGWGTRARSCKESITQSEADKRLGSIVKKLTTRISREFPTLDSKQKAGLISFAYNCHSGYIDVLKNGLQQHKFWCRTAGGEHLQGLVNRRLEEQTLIFNK